TASTTRRTAERRGKNLPACPEPITRSSWRATERTTWAPTKESSRARTDTHGPSSTDRREERMVSTATAFASLRECPPPDKTSPIFLSSRKQGNAVDIAHVTDDG